VSALFLAITELFGPTGPSVVLGRGRGTSCKR
jgi:hypothetical protein